MWPAASVSRLEAFERRPGPLRVHVVGGHRRDPAPVVDPGLEQRDQIVGEVGRGLEVDLGRQDQPGHRDRPAGTRRRGTAASRNIAVPGLGRKFWTMTSWTWPWRRWDAAMASSDVDPVGPGLADADQDPGREGDGQLAGRLERGQPAGRGLVRGAAVGVEALGQGLEHHPLAGRHRPEPGQLVGVEGAGVGVGEQPGLLAAPPSHIAAR